MQARSLRSLAMTKRDYETFSQGSGELDRVNVYFLGEMKTIDSAFDSGKMRARVDFLERSYKIDLELGA